MIPHNDIKSFLRPSSINNVLKLVLKNQRGNVSSEEYVNVCSGSRELTLLRASIFLGKVKEV